MVAARRLGVVDEEAELGRVLTAPNLITLVRLLCIPLFLWLLFGLHRQTAAAVLLAVLGATDWIDGFVARRYHQVSTLGKVLDPAADRILVGHRGHRGDRARGGARCGSVWPPWPGKPWSRSWCVLLAALGAARINVLWIGKAGTFALMFSYPAFLLSYGTAAWQGPIRVIAWGCGLIGLALGWAAAAGYVGPARDALRTGRAARTRHGSAARASAAVRAPYESGGGAA